ncbi:MAG TPA: DUF1566 domain-containing protein [Desulfuromonadales bacterium]|nr:DUF1566 domain-containing protein [Desulfuromonadales bacterium]
MLENTICTMKSLLGVGLFILLTGCSSGNSDSASTGSITAQLVWNAAGKTTAKTVASAPAGVATVRIMVSGSGIAPIIQKDFAAGTGSGTIDGVPAGTGRTLNVQGLDAAGKLTHQGTAANITVQAGLTTDAGTITMAAVSATTTTTGALTYPVVDTGQSKTYNSSAEIAAPSAGQPFYGQDAQYNGVQPGYTLSSDGTTVYDTVTKLTWMRAPNTTLAAPASTDKMTYSQAQAWVASVNAMKYGSFSDWRLPTIKELYSLMIFKGTDPSSFTGTDTSVLTPFIDRAYFKFSYGQTAAGERIIDSQYASSTIFVLNPAETGYPKLFGLNLADGRIKGYDLIMPDGRTEKTFFVQLVRGGTSYGVNSYADNGDGTITDAATGLMWSKEDSGSGMIWQDALALVQAKNAAKHLGHSDWRLPNAKELQSIVNYANAPDYNGRPAIDTAFFSSSVIVNENGDSDYPYYWTSTTHAGYSATGSSGSQAVYIPFGRALGWPSGALKWVDVHGAGCQRSDPKTAPPYSYATAHSVSKSGKTYSGYAFGPQGDAIRGLNFVRLVRNTL